MDQDGIVAIGLLTRRDLDQLGPTFKWAWPVEDAPEFDELLRAIDRADEEARAQDVRGTSEHEPRAQEAPRSFEPEPRALSANEARPSCGEACSEK